MNASGRQQSSQRLGRYELLEEIGSGGFSTVYRARLRGPAQARKDVAVKLIHQQLSADRQAVLMFLDEMRLAMSITHRNIVQTFDAGRDGENYFLAMELVDGCSLASLLHRQASAGLPLDLAVFVGMEVCAALEYAHSFSPTSGGVCGIIHRDVSPSNILISSHGDVKLVDFGVAKAAGRLIVSREHSVKGKPTYMAPEQARGGVTTRSDLFSVGAVLYEMITGKRLRPSGNLDTIRGFPGVSDPLSAQRADTPLVLDRLVRRCLAREPSDRPASARELRQELGQVLRRLVTPGFEGHERMARFVATDLAGQDGLGDVFRAMRGQLEELTATARPAPLPPATAPQGPEVDGVVLLPRSTSVSPPPTPMAAPVSWRRVALAALLLLGLVLGVAVTASLRGSASLEGMAPPLPDSGDPAFGRIAEQVRPTAAAEPTSSLDEGRRSAGTGAASMPVRNVDAGHTDPGPRQLGNKPRRRVKPERPRTTKTQRSPTKAQRPRAKAQRPRAKTQRPRAAAGQPDADAGRLYLNSRPWTIVEIDGKYVGETPIEGISIAPGTHRVYLYNRHEGVAHTLWLRVRAKQVVRRVLTLP